MRRIIGRLLNVINSRREYVAYKKMNKYFDKYPNMSEESKDRLRHACWKHLSCGVEENFHADIESAARIYAKEMEEKTGNEKLGIWWYYKKYYEWVIRYHLNLF